MIDYGKMLSKTVCDLKPSGIRRFFDMLADMKDVISGWNDGYHSTDEVVDASGNPILGNIVISNQTKVVIGLRGQAEAGAWGHNDDWILVKVEG